MSLTNRITYQHLSADMQLIADVCGIDVVRTLMVELPGTRLYVPHPNRIEPLVQAYIAELHTQNVPIRTIAKEVGLSIDYVRSAVRAIEGGT